jgi:3-dehydroquinate dehydratase
MSGNENRRSERYPLKGQPDGRIFIKAESLRSQADYIRDISSSGISIALDRAISAMSDVAIEYLTSGGHIEVYGKVAWCKPNAAVSVTGRKVSAYLLGIEILSSMTLFSLLQSHTMR